MVGLVFRLAEIQAPQKNTTDCHSEQSEESDKEDYFYPDNINSLIIKTNIMSERISDHVSPGVAAGEDVQIIFEIAKRNKFALPAVNVVGTDTVNAVLESAKAVNSPVIIQFSNGGAHFYAGKSLNNDEQRAAINGAISGAIHVHNIASQYGVPVILHTDHAAKKTLTMD
jgi:hypothetical protein